MTGSLRPPKTDKLNLMYEKSKCVEFGFALGHRFVAVELPREDARDRSVSFYADKMAITHKYLSMCVKSSSGKTPLEWIENNVVPDARAQLASTTRTVQQISDSLGFTTQSDFGRYFKRVTGMSPKAYRAKAKG